MKLPKNPEIFQMDSNIGFEHEESVRLLHAVNTTIQGLNILDEPECLYEHLNVTTDVQDAYAQLVKAWNIDFYDIACKIEVLRTLIFGDTLDWNHIERILKTHSDAQSQLESNSKGEVT